MKQTLSWIAAVYLAGMSGSAWADNNNWQGANTSGKAETDLDMENPAFWSLGHVPTTGDTAVFAFTVFQTNLTIGAGSAFAPSSLTFTGGVLPPWDWAPYIAIDKSLTMSNLILNVGNDQSSNYPFDRDRLRIGTLTSSPVTLTLTGNGEPLNISSPSSKGSWANLLVGAPNVIIDLTGTNITFSRGAQYMTPSGGIGGGNDEENAGCTSNSTFKFSGDNATITLKEQGVRFCAAFDAGRMNLAVKTNQTWNCDPEAFVNVAFRHGNLVAATAGPDIIRSLDGGRLDNLGNLNIRVKRIGNGMWHNSKATGMRLAGGTYGGLLLAVMPDNNYPRADYVVLKDNVVLQGRAVMPSDTTNAATPYSLVLQSGGSPNSLNHAGAASKSYWYLDTDGYGLALSNSLYFVDTSSQELNNTTPRATLIADGSTITVGSDIVIYSLYTSPLGALVPQAGFGPTIAGRYFGIAGNSATVINLGGSFSNNCMSMIGDGLSKSTVNLIGGAGVKYFEVGDAGTNTVLRTDSFAIANLNVGNGTTAGNVQLVNNFVNDNPLVASNITDRIGEKLMVSNLNIKAASTLDVNAQFVHVQTALTIASDGWLDLHTGGALADGATVTNFYGAGDQSTGWATYSSRVKDTSNPTRQFVPSYVGADSKTYWQIAPAGATIIMIQ